MITLFVVLALILLFPEAMGWLVGMVIRLSFVLLVCFGLLIAMGVR